MAWRPESQHQRTTLILIAGTSGHRLQAEESWSTGESNRPKCKDCTMNPFRKIIFVVVIEHSLDSNPRTQECPIHIVQSHVTLSISVLNTP